MSWLDESCGEMDEPCGAHEDERPGSLSGEMVELLAAVDDVEL